MDDVYRFRKRLIKVVRFCSTGAIAQFEYLDEPGNRFMPLIVDGKNVEIFDKVSEKQLNLF